MAGSEIKVMWERILNYTITEQKTSNIHEFLKAHGYSSSLIRAIKEDTEGIRLNGEPVLARTLLTPGDQLAIRITAISAVRHCTHIICVSGIQSQEKKCISQRLCLKICYSDKYI